MGESKLTINFEKESELTEFAGFFSENLVATRCLRLVIGLTGDLGSGKTTWVRAMLRGLGYSGRVPSPTYTLLEQYRIGDLSVVHLDLYRLNGDEELENLGLRDWLAEPRTWVLLEWPERAPRLAKQCDLLLALEDRGGVARAVTLSAQTQAGIEALERGCHSVSR